MLEFFGTSPCNILIRCTTLKSSPLAAKPAACVREWWRIIKYRYEPGLKKVTDRFDMWNYYCRRLHVITIPGPGPTRVEQSSEGNYPIPWTASLMHDSDRSQKKRNFPGYKGSSEYHKRGDGDQAKKNPDFIVPLLPNGACIFRLNRNTQ